MNKYFFLLAIILLFGVTNCRTRGVTLKETPLNVSETRRAVVSLIGEPRSISTNGREIFSQYLDKKDRIIEKMEMIRERHYTHITILGDRRPYDVQVEVVVEQRNAGGGFDAVLQDDEKARKIAENLMRVLNQSRDNRNVIDDFRSF